MPLPLAAIGLGISAAAGIGQSIHGGIQAGKGRRALEGLDRPTYEAPEEYQQNVASARAASQQGIGAAQKRFFTENILRGRQDALAASSSRRGGLIGIGNVVRGEQQAFGNLAMQDVAARERGQAQLTQARNVLGQQREKEFAINEMQPYQQDLTSAQAMIGAGTQNIFGGLNTIAGTGIQGATAMNEMQALNQREKQLTGGYNTPAPSYTSPNYPTPPPVGGVIQPLAPQGKEAVGLSGGGGYNWNFGNN